MIGRRRQTLGDSSRIGLGRGQLVSGSFECCCESGTQMGIPEILGMGVKSVRYTLGIVRGHTLDTYTTVNLPY